MKLSRAKYVERVTKEVDKAKAMLADLGERLGRGDWFSAEYVAGHSGSALYASAAKLALYSSLVSLLTSEETKVSKHATVPVIKQMLRDRVSYGAKYPGRSTCPYSNLAEQEKLIINAHELEFLEYYDEFDA